ncbi:hypothetical protein [Streptomyces sp. NPDC020141]|uniref:hypothetical protein n=1 Tax=Streptomyces sp. NPDC020141 TaxID=3365065 RepID=UPI00379D3684
MAELHYEILTDPSELRVSGAGQNEESLGAVYLSVTNRSTAPALITGFELSIPSGPGADDLSSDLGRSGYRTVRRTGQGWNSAFDSWAPTLGVLQISTSSSTIRILPGEVLVMEIYGFPVSQLPGLVQLTVKEDSLASGPSFIPLSLLKRQARVPGNFRAEKTLLDPTDQVVLRWDGPSTLDYQIQGPDGTLQAVTGTGPHWTWSPAAGDEPKRDATYTLIATPTSGTEPGYFLTATVHVLRPEFPSLTVTEALHTPLVTGTGAQQGQVSFTSDGVRVLDAAGADGTVIAKAAELETVTASSAVHTPTVTGTTPPSRIDFTADGVRVLDAAGASGTVEAGTIDAQSVLTSEVRGRGADPGWVRFPDDGIVVGHGPGTDLGVVTADRIRANGVNTPWVGDVDGGRGRLEFGDSGASVYRDGSQTLGTVAAGTADLDDLVTVRAQVEERLTLQGGLTVDGVLETQDGPPRLIVHGRLDAEDEVRVVEGVRINGDLTVRGDVGVEGKTNANGHLAVRAGDAWIIHTDDGQVSLQGDLRVHGNFRSNG